jgi:hypothetical protein
MVMIGASGTIIVISCSDETGLAGAAWSNWICLLPLGSAVLGALPVLGAIRALRRALRARDNSLTGRIE